MVSLPRWMAGEEKATPGGAAEPYRPGPGRARERQPDRVPGPDERPGPGRARERQPKPADKPALQPAPREAEPPFGLSNETQGSWKLTDAEYKALSPRQQSAVDFNTLLTRAVEKDRKGGGDSTKDTRYAKQAGQVFKEAGSPSSTYAPNTMNLLSSIGYQASDGATLDDFLNLRAGISENEMGAIDGKAEGVDWNTFNNRLAESLEKAFKADFGKGELRGQRNKLLGLPDTPGHSGEDSVLYEAGFDLLARKGSHDNLDEAKRILSTNFTTPEAFSKFWQYVDSRSREASLKNQPLGISDAPEGYYTPEQFRDLYVGSK